MAYLDPNEFIAAWHKMFLPEDVVELRLIGTRGRNDIRSGYFREPETAAASLLALGDSLRGVNVYWTINTVHEGCYSRLQRDRFLPGPITTSDADIIRRRWLPVDFDAARPAGCSASQAERDEALRLCKEVGEKLTAGLGLPRCLRQVSGNGGHLLIPINYPNTEEARQAVRRFLQTLDEAYSTDRVHVDLTTYNAARVLKVPGTLACKGINTPERPWRKAFVFPDDADYIRPAEEVTNL